MKKRIIISFIACLIAGLLFQSGPAGLQAETVFVTIGSGDFTGVYFPTGLTIAQMINAKRNQYGIRATVESSRASVFNVNAISAGYLEFGLVQSDTQYRAVKGLGEWAQKGPQSELRAVFSIHPESVNLLAAMDTGIKTMADLKGKRVSLGNPGSGQYEISISALEALGFDPRRDISPVKVKASEASRLLQDNRIDAFFCTLGHPNGTLQQATSGERKVRFIPMTGPDIDKLISGRDDYFRMTVPVGQFYPGAEDPVDLKTFGIVATLCTGSWVPANVVYTIVKVVFDNFEEFKRQHPSRMALEKKDMLKGLTAPLHPGAVKYYQEAGLMK